MYTNPAEFLLNLVNTDFADDIDTANDTLRKLTTRYLAMASTLTVERANRIASDHTIMALREEHFAGPNSYLLPLTLIHRSFVKSYRDIIVYGIRVVMYVGLAIIMGTVWLRLVPEGDGIQAYGNAIVSVTVLCPYTSCAKHNSFSVEPLCRSWQLHMFPHTLRIELSISKRDRTVFMDPRRSWSRILLLEFHISVGRPSLCMSLS